MFYTEPLIVAGTMTSRKKDIIIEWCNTWTGNGNVRLCNGDDVVLTDNIYEISRYLGRVVDPALYGKVLQIFSHLYSIAQAHKD